MNATYLLCLVVRDFVLHRFKFFLTKIHGIIAMQLYTPTNLNQLEQDLPYLIKTMEWVENFVGRSHPDLGRPGPVCPFVPHSIRLNSMSLAVLRIQNLEKQQLIDSILRYRDIFLETEPREGVAALKKSLLIVLPDVNPDDATQIIDSNHQILKPFFVKLGLMIGEFHKHTQGTGAHNPKFHPFQSPIPMFVIRYMVESDILFLQDKNPYLRIQYLQAYLNYLETVYSQRFGQKIKDETKLEKARQLIQIAQEQLQAESLDFTY